MIEYILLAVGRFLGLSFSFSFNYLNKNVARKSNQQERQHNDCFSVNGQVMAITICLKQCDDRVLRRDNIPKTEPRLFQRFRFEKAASLFSKNNVP